MVFDQVWNLALLQFLRPLVDLTAAHLHAVGVDALELLLLKGALQPLQVVNVHCFHRLCSNALTLLTII